MGSLEEIEIDAIPPPEHIHITVRGVLGTRDYEQEQVDRPDYDFECEPV